MVLHGKIIIHIGLAVAKPLIIIAVIVWTGNIVIFLQIGGSHLACH